MAEHIWKISQFQYTFVSFWKIKVMSKLCGFVFGFYLTASEFISYSVIGDIVVLNKALFLFHLLPITETEMSWFVATLATLSARLRKRHDNVCCLNQMSGCQYIPNTTFCPTVTYISATMVNTR